MIKFFFGPKGLELELAKIEAAKEEIIAIQKSMKDLYKQMLYLNIAFLESTKRLTWEGPPNYDELIFIIKANCKALGLSNIEVDYVFQHKTLWEEKDKKDLNKRE